MLMANNFPQATENLCSQKLGAGLYDKIRRECERHILDKRNVLQRLSRVQDPATYLITVNTIWNDYCQAMVLSNKMMMVNAQAID